MSHRQLRVVPGEEAEASSERPTPLDFDEFFATESEELFRRMWLVTRNRAEAEEVMQDAFLSIYERWDRMAMIDDPKAHLYRTAFNAWNKRSRRAARALRVAFTQPARGDDVDAADARTVIEDVVQRLHRRTREVVLRNAFVVHVAVPGDDHPYADERQQHERDAILHELRHG